LEFFVTESLLLTNPSNVSVDFYFTTKTENFVLVPSKGTIEESKAVKIEVTYRPKTAQKRFEEEIMLHVKDGPPKPITCSAGLAEASCVLKKKAIDFGLCMLC
jgi:hypothetical protein